MLLGQSEQANMAVGGLFGWPGTSHDHWELAVEMCCGLTQERNESNGLQLVLSGRWLASEKPPQICYYILVKRTSFSLCRSWNFIELKTNMSQRVTVVHSARKLSLCCM